ncbi:MAG: hypothetical protein IKH38_04075 [Clostridia bacterium]|nr:hypothetical protein [Clostridia bacterium]
MRRGIAGILILGLLCAGTAMGEETFQLDVSQTEETVTSSGFLQVICPAEPGEVSLRVADENGIVYYAGITELAGTEFISDEIYLPLASGNANYTVSVETGGTRYETHLVRTLPRVENVSACAAGYPVQNGSVTLLDVAELEAGTVTVPLVAGGVYGIGEVSYSLVNGALIARVRLDESAACTITQSAVQVALNAADAMRLCASKNAGIQGMLEEEIPLMGAPFAAVHVRLTVSFDPAAQEATSSGPLPGQEDLLRRFREFTEAGSVG